MLTDLLKNISKSLDSWTTVTSRQSCRNGCNHIFFKHIDCKFDLKQCTWLKQCTKDWIETVHKMLSIAMSKHKIKMAPMICPAGRIISWKMHSWGKMLHWLRIQPCKPANYHQKQALLYTGSYFNELYLIFWSQVEMVEIPKLYSGERPSCCRRCIVVDSR